MNQINNIREFFYSKNAIINCHDESKMPMSKNYTTITKNGWSGIRYNPIYSKTMGILCGPYNGIFVIDLDVLKSGDTINKIDGVKYFNENIMEISEIDTLIIQSPSGGYHLYFEDDGCIEIFNKKIKNVANIFENNRNIKIDFRAADKGYICYNENYKVIKNLYPQKIPDYLITKFNQINNEINIGFEDIKKKEKKKKDNNDKIEEYIDKNFNSISNYDDICNIVNNLNIKYSDTYEDWRNIGFCLRSIGKGTDKYKECFREFSKKCPLSIIYDLYSEDSVRRKNKFIKSESALIKYISLNYIIGEHYLTNRFTTDINKPTCYKFNTHKIKDDLEKKQKIPKDLYSFNLEIDFKE